MKALFSKESGAFVYNTDYVLNNGNLYGICNSPATTLSGEAFLLK